jgi:Concanavalin A-like lectin/glucanases superfamily
MAQGIFTRRQQLQGLIQGSWYGPTQPILPSFSTYQASFNGSNQTLSIADSANIRLGSGDFTIECWTNTTYANGGTTAAFACQYPDAAGAGSYIFGIRAGVIFIWDNSTSYTAATTINTGSWTHIAWVRSGSGTNNNTVYVNGKADLQFTNTTNFTGASYAFQVGRWGTSSAILSGYVSNLRIVKGTAVYTGNFNPPTAALTAVTNTQLLTLQGPTIIDNSTNAFSITNNGSVGMTATTVAINQTVAPSINPPPAVDYLVVAGGGAGGGGAAYSGGGGGAGGLLQGITPVTAGTSLTVTVGTGGSGTSGHGTNGTNSVFAQITAIGGGGGTYGYSTSGYDGGSGGGGGSTYTPSVSNLPSNGVLGQGNGGGSNSLGGNGSGGGAGTKGLSSVNTSNGINGGAGIASAITGTVTAYAGGGASGSSYASGTFSAPGGVGGGGRGAYYDGATATTATSGTTNTGGGGGGGCNGTGCTVAGSGGSGIVIISYPDTYNAPAALTGTVVAGTSGSGSVQFNGSNSIKYGPNSAIDLGSSNFTIEGWVYPTTSGGFLAQRQAGSASGWAIGGGTSGGLIGGVWYPDFGTGTVYLNAWQHNAWVRSGTTMYFFINGVLVRTTTGVTGAVDVWAQPMNMGSSSSDGTEGRLTGYVSNARIVSGTALYTSTFTPSTTPLTPVSGTLFLNNAVSGAPFVDTSTNYFTPTFAGSGSPVWNQSSPFATGLGYKNRVYTWTSSGTITF